VEFIEGTFISKESKKYGNSGRISLLSENLEAIPLSSTFFWNKTFYSPLQAAC
jgi:hypothetical protein